MRHILMAGLPIELAHWLEQTIDEVLVRVTGSGEETLVALAWGGWSVLVIDHNLPGIPSPDVVSLARDELELAKLPVLYCLETAVGNDVAAGLVKRIGLGQLVFHPINWDTLAVRIELAIGQIDHRAERTNHIDDHRVLAPFLQLPAPAVEEGLTELASDDHAVMFAGATTFESYADVIPDAHEGQLLDFDAAPATDSPPYVFDLVDIESNPYLLDADEPESEAIISSSEVHTWQDDEDTADSESADDTRTTQQKTMDAVAALWDKFKYLCFERVRVLDAFTSALQNGTLLDGQQTEGSREARNLAGSLGSVGFPEGSRLASQVEHIIQDEASISPDELTRLLGLVASLKKEIGYSPPELEAEISRQEEQTIINVPDAPLPEHKADEQAAQEQTIDAVAVLWERFKGTNFERAAVLEQYVTLLLEGSLTDEARRSAEREAHKLAGTLGTFGLPEGSSIARQMEHILQGDALLSLDQTRSLSELVLALGHELERGPAAVEDKADDQAIPESDEPEDSPESIGDVESVDVVVIDDDEVLAELLLHTLMTRGYSAKWLEDGQAAIERLTGSTPTLATRVILLDVDMPSISGLDVLRQLAGDGLLNHTRVIMLTARAAEAETVMALELGAFDHVAKPFSPPVLLQRIRRAFQA